jgi:hypothetical protein
MAPLQTEVESREVSRKTEELTGWGRRCLGYWLAYWQLRLVLDGVEQYSVEAM